MARSALAVQQISRAGVVPAYTAANAAGHSIVNNGRTFLHVKVGATPTNVTLDSPVLVDGQAVAGRVIAIGANTEKMIGPFPDPIFDQPDGSGVDVDFSSVATVTVGAFSL